MDNQKLSENETELLESVRNDIILTFPLAILFVIAFLRLTCLFCKKYGQKTRSQPQRRAYVGSRARTSISQNDPTIYVSPANYPPPPKYEAMAPPSYEEVVGVHYPNYQAGQFQPIVRPLAVALAQNPPNQTTIAAPGNNVCVSPNNGDPSAENAAPAQSTVVKVSSESTTTITVASS